MQFALPSGTKPHVPKEEPNKVHLSNLPSSATEESLSKALAEHGPVFDIPAVGPHVVMARELSPRGAAASSEEEALSG